MIIGIQSRWGLINLESDDDADEDSDTDSEIFPDIDQEIENEIDPNASHNTFHGEVFESLQRGLKEGIKVDNLVLEINGSKFAYDQRPGQVIQVNFSPNLVQTYPLRVENQGIAMAPLFLRLIDLFMSFVTIYWEDIKIFWNENMNFN